MIKNRTAFKLSLYFGAALIAFAVIIGAIFMLLFRNHTTSIHKTELTARAESIADTLSLYMENQGGMGFGMYIRSISDIAGADAWVIDENLNLITAGGGMMGHMDGRQPVTYADLPQNADEIIKEVFLDKTVFSRDFSGVMSEPTLTVGVPVKNRNNEVVGVVLLHSPVKGTNEAIKNGMGMLIISIIAGLLLSFLLSLWLSKSFTDPMLVKEAEDALRLEKIRRDFVANISHELKTPVTVMRGSLEALTEKVVTEPEMVDSYHHQMLREAIHLQRLVGDLLDLSRLQNADFIIEKQEISFGDIIDEAVRSAVQISQTKQVHIHVRKDSGCMVWGDYGRLRQMLLIVLDNAVKFSPECGVVEMELKNAVLTVRDFGAGINEEELPYIFDRFYKTSSEENKSGTGLGLAIAKQIAERHGIGLFVQNMQGQGACFIFDLSKSGKKP